MSSHRELSQGKRGRELYVDRTLRTHPARRCPAARPREVEQILNQGKWEHPSDKMAVYTEIGPGRRWGVRVTLFGNSATVEAVDGPHCCWHRVPRRFFAQVGPPSFWERLRGITFLDKLAREVEAKRAVAREEEMSH